MISDAQRRANRLVYEKKRKIIDEAKAKPCMDCGHNYATVCMDLDHRDPSTKKFNPSQFLSHSYADLISEIAKCDVVCANCHRLRTHQVRDVQQPLW